MAGWLISNGSASSVTVASPLASRARMARRVGSARAAKVRSRRSEACITVPFYNVMVIYKGKTGQSRLSGLFERSQQNAIFVRPLKRLIAFALFTQSAVATGQHKLNPSLLKIGRASCRERV